MVRIMETGIGGGGNRASEGFWFTSRTSSQPDSAGPLAHTAAPVGLGPTHPLSPSPHTSAGSPWPVAILPGQRA